MLYSSEVVWQIGLIAAFCLIFAQFGVEKGVGFILRGPDIDVCFFDYSILIVVFFVCVASHSGAVAAILSKSIALNIVDFLQQHVASAYENIDHVLQVKGFPVGFQS